MWQICFSVEDHDLQAQKPRLTAGVGLQSTILSHYHRIASKHVEITAIIIINIDNLTNLIFKEELIMLFTPILTIDIVKTECLLNL